MKRRNLHEDPPLIPARAATDAFINQGNNVTIAQYPEMGEEIFVVVSLDDAEVLANHILKIVREFREGIYHSEPTPMPKQTDFESTQGDDGV